MTEPRDRGIDEFLADVRSLRLTLATDLSAAAGALDAGEPEVARDIVAADQIEVRRLGLRPPITPPTPVRRRRALLLLPAIPLAGILAMTGAAAAFVGSASGGHRVAVDSPHGVHHDGADRTARAAATTLDRLRRDVTRHESGGEVIAVADRLHHQLREIILGASPNAGEIGEVRHLLSVEQRLLKSHHGRGTAAALADSRKLDRLLTSRVVATVTVPTPPTQSSPPVVAPSVDPTTPPVSRPATPPTTAKTASIPTSSPSSPSQHSTEHKSGGNRPPDPLRSTGLNFGDL